MIPVALNVLGRLLAIAPESALRGCSVVGGECILWLAPRRRRVLRSNLHHAFPEKPRNWRRRIARESSRRVVETAMLSLAEPFLSERRIRKLGRLGASVEGFARDLKARPRPVVLGTLHLALWESQTWLKLLSETPLPEYGIIFRPLKNPALDAFVKRTRERHGMRLLSRREGFSDAQTILKANGCVGVLFDQNAGERGALSLLFDRVCSSTELPGILAAKARAEVWTYYPRRTGFWRVTFETEPVANDGTPEGVTLALNRWFEIAMADDDLCASWLWAHDRWKTQDAPERRLRLEARRDRLDADLRLRGLTCIPRRTRIWVRMPNWLGDVVMALPLIRALRTSRPDAEITLLAKPGFAALLESFGVADRVRPLPESGSGYFARFASLRSEYPDVWILLTNSVRGDLEARVAGCPQRFGILRPGRWRPLLTHAFAVPGDFDEAKHPQLELGERFLRQFGLTGPIDRTPISANRMPEGPVGLIPGSENDPSKRWPVARWRELIEAMPSKRFTVFGTQADGPIAAQVCQGYEAERVQNLAGRTTLAAFADALRACRLLVTNDTGGMHLANALGVPLVALFGPTNPVRTGPVFTAPFRIVQPPGCPPGGGAALAGLSAAAVAAAVRDLPIQH